MARRLWDKGEALHPEILAYTVGDDHVLDLELVEEDVWGSLAHARMLEERGIISPDDRRAIARGLLEVLALHREGALRISPEEEDVHTAVEGRLAERVGEPGRRLHTGRSRNDQVLVDVRLFARRRLLDAADAGLALARALLDLARDHEAVVMPGYTHMRQAMPSSVGLWAGGHAECVADSVEALLEAYGACDRCPLGSAAGFGVPLPLDRRRTAALLGFTRLQVNAQAVQSSRGKPEAQALFAAVLLGNDLARLAWDLQLYTGPELGFFRLAPDVATGSSIMPQKRNPDVLELTRAQAGVLHAHLERILLVAGRLPSSYHRDYQLTKEPVLKGLRLARAMARAMELTVSGLEVERERAEAAVATEAFATHRALELAARGVPFRDAYRQVGDEVARGALARPTDLDAVRRAYATEGSPGDLRLDDAAGRLGELEARARDARAALEGCLEALEREAAGGAA
ncbi:MAG: argininosuccinate lyase [Planctomycetes bacterium]|nr:argininosuccinate lyase [Planctomycetota bacterium]